MPRFAAYWLHPLLILLGLAAGPARAQRVGLVLSGGGAKGLAHIGVLKELEANNIPIDYIVGTSMGAVVGGLYAAGYSPAQIEQLARSPDFQAWALGQASENHVFNYLLTEPSPAALRLGGNLDSTGRLHVSPVLLNDLNLNFALARLLAPAGAASGYDFDKLLVPFRCLAAEVFTRQQVVQQSGSLADAVRNSMSFPLAYRPIRSPDGRYLFDGGVYNNFPTDVMHRAFAPDLIIGVNVGDVAAPSYPFQNADHLLAGTLLFLGTNQADTLLRGHNGVLIEPDLSGYGEADFAGVGALIARGDSAARQRMALLRQRVGRRTDTAALGPRRRQFRVSAPPLRFTQVLVPGLPAAQAAYVQRFFRRAGPAYTLPEIEDGYYRLAADAYFRNLYPRIRYEAAQQGYVFVVDTQRRENVALEAGLLLASRPLENAYLGLEYRALRRRLLTFGANASVGSFYNAGQGFARVSVPGRLPAYVEAGFTDNQWTYQHTGGLFDRDVLSTPVRQLDQLLGLRVGLGPHYRLRALLEGSAFLTRDHYANGPDADEAGRDELTLRGSTAVAQVARYTLNRKQYATAGRRVAVALRGVRGTATYAPGPGSAVAGRADFRQWLQLRATAERYFPLGGEGRAWGYFLEVVASGQGLFATYRSSVVREPAFAPLPDAATLLLPAYRSARYAAAGLRYSRPLLGPVAWRTEVFVHVNFQPLREGENQQATRLGGPERPRLTASTGLVYQTPLGPLALHARYYDDPAGGFGVFAHVGYLGSAQKTENIAR